MNALQLRWHNRAQGAWQSARIARHTSPSAAFRDETTAFLLDMGVVLWTSDQGRFRTCMEAIARGVQLVCSHEPPAGVQECACRWAHAVTADMLRDAFDFSEVSP